MLPEISSGNGSAERRAYDNTSQPGSIQMTPGGPGSNANSVPSKKLKASAVGNIIHQDQKEDRGSHKKPKRMEGDEDMPNQGSRETSRARQNVSGLNSQKRASKAEGSKALRQSQNSKIGMGSHQVRKSVKGKSTPAQHQQVGHHDDADEYAEDEFE